MKYQKNVTDPFFYHVFHQAKVKTSSTILGLAVTQSVTSAGHRDLQILEAAREISEVVVQRSLPGEGCQVDRQVEGPKLRRGLLLPGMLHPTSRCQELQGNSNPKLRPGQEVKPRTEHHLHSVPCAKQ